MIFVFLCFGYQVQDGGQDLVDRLNLVAGETNDLHGVGDGLEVGPVVDAGLQRKDKERRLRRLLGSIQLSSAAVRVAAKRRRRLHSHTGPLLTFSELVVGVNSCYFAP